MRILCVDDDQTTRLYYSQGLAEALASDEIDVVASGEEAVEKLDAGGYDIVLTDLVMPGLSGLDVLQAAREVDPRTAVIVITGQASVSTAIEAMRGGARDYAEKPISIPLVLEKIENVRDYSRQCAEAEDIRAAMEASLAQSSHQQHVMERKLQAAQAAIVDAVRILETEEDADQNQRLADALAALKSGLLGQ